MKLIISVVILIFSLFGCKDDSKTITKNTCLKKGQSYKIEKNLNLRTGKYEKNVICIERD